MQEFIKKINEELNNICQYIDDTIKLQKTDLKAFDKSLKSYKGKEINKVLKERERIINAKANTAFWEKDIPELVFFLDNAKHMIASYKKTYADVGGRDNPNQKIIELIKQGILTTNSPVCKFHKGKECIAYLTEDGFIEVEINGGKKKLSLRKAALVIWGTNPANQWTFWEASYKGEEKKPLEYFLTLLK